MDIEEIYQEAKPLIINDCELVHQIDDMIYSGKIKEEIKDEMSNTTNIIVTKYADSSSELPDDSLLDLPRKEKIIEVELLPSNVQNKGNFAALLNGVSVKKNIKKRIDISDHKKFSQNSVKKKKIKCSNLIKEHVKITDVTSKIDMEQNSHDITVCSECNKQFTSVNLLKRHLLGCKINPLGSALCSKCGKHFSSNYNLKRHMTSCKLCPDNEKSPRYMCQCGRTYSQEWDMKKHKLKCKDGKKKCKHCLVSNCNLLFYHKAQLIAHMKKDHNMVIQDPKVLNFSSFDEFLLWKEKEEEETFTYYSKQTGSNVSGISVNTYYVCQHDGSDRTHTSAPRKTDRRNKKGRIKTGRLCWSQMNVKQFKDGTVKVTYFPSHTHPVSIADTEHHPLPSSITMEIKRRFSEISKLNENEGIQRNENQELCKGRRKRYGMSLRTLRALARKNRSLFRITAEATQKGDVSTHSVTDKNFILESQSQNSHSVNENVMQVCITDHEENADDPEPVHSFNVGDSSHPQNNGVILEDCIHYMNDIKTHLLSGKLPHSILIQIQESLKNVCSLWNEAVQNPQLGVAKSFSSSQEVMMCQSQSPLPVAEIFPLQEEINTNLESNGDLKSLEAASGKTVYQVIAVDEEEKSNEYLYQNAVEVIGTREFIIIAGDHAQFSHSADPGVQFDLS